MNEVKYISYAPYAFVARGGRGCSSVCIFSICRIFQPANKLETLETVTHYIQLALGLRRSSFPGETVAKKLV